MRLSKKANWKIYTIGLKIIILKNNKINNLILDADFPNDKKISLTVLTNDAKETTTSLITDYPKPLIKRYKFIKGFEEGNLNFNKSNHNCCKLNVLKC